MACKGWEPDDASVDRVPSEQDVVVDTSILDPRTESAHQQLLRLGGEGSTCGEIGLGCSWGGKLAEDNQNDPEDSGAGGMKKQRYKKFDDRWGKRPQTSWDTGTAEPSSQERSGWDEDIHPEPSSWTQVKAEPPIAPDNRFLEPAGDVDAGYFDQQVPILGTDVTVRVAYTAQGIDSWIDECPANEGVFGFDVEWRPNFQKGGENYAALCQLSSATRCLIVQLLYLDYIPDNLKAFLADPRKKLAGVGVKGDITKLYEDYGLKCRGEVDLRIYAANVFEDPKLKQASLATLCSSVLGIPYKKSKRVTMSNWSVQGLSYSQILYAATDAWIAHSLLATLEAKQREQPSTDNPRAIPDPLQSGPHERTKLPKSSKLWSASKA